MGGAQAPTQGRRQLQAINGESLLQAFPQAGCRPWVVGGRPLGLFLEFDHALLPGQMIDCLHLRRQVVGQLVADIFDLMAATARRRAGSAKHPVDGRAERLGAVDDQETAALGVNATCQQVF